jgi:seryl-tRNA synthetase
MSVEEQERDLEEMLSPKEDILAELETSYSKVAENTDEDDEDLRRFMALAEG